MSKVPASQHLKELRTRFTIVAAFFILGACLAYSFQEPVINAILAPLHGEKLVYLNPAGGFNFIFLISIYAGLALAIPILIQQLYAFVRPALPDTAQKKSSTLIIGSFLLLVAGIAFGYFVAVPSALAFLYGFADQFINASLTADSYLNFVIAYTIGIGLVFQIPLLLLLVNSIKPLTPGGLWQSEKWVILISFILAAIITPTPDPINQLIIAGPVVVVYQIGVFIILFSIMKKRRAAKRHAKHVAVVEAITRRETQPAQQRPIRPHLAPAPLAKQLQPLPTLIPKPVPIHQHPQPAPSHTLDSFGRPIRPSIQSIAVPQRPQIEAPVAPRVITHPGRGSFTIDGMRRPLHSA